MFDSFSMDCFSTEQQHAPLFQNLNRACHCCCVFPPATRCFACHLLVNIMFFGVYMLLLHAGWPPKVGRLLREIIFSPGVISTGKSHFKFFYFLYIFLLPLLFSPFVMENTLKCWKRWFWPAYLVQRKLLLSKLHITQFWIFGFKEVKSIVVWGAMVAETGVFVMGS